jgi:putative transposase
MRFPAAHRTRLHATNPIERLDGEIRRRTDVVGSSPNETAVVRLVGTVSDTATVSLAAVPA